MFRLLLFLELFRYQIFPSVSTTTKEVIKNEILLAHILRNYRGWTRMYIRHIRDSSHPLVSLLKLSHQILDLDTPFEITSQLLAPESPRPKGKQWPRGIEED